MTQRYLQPALKTRIGVLCSGRIRHGPSNPFRKSALSEKELYPRLIIGGANTNRCGCIAEVNRLCCELREPQHEHRHRVVAVKIGVEDEIRLVGDASYELPRRCHCLRLQYAAGGDIVLRRVQLSHEGRQGVGECGSTHSPPILPLCCADGGCRLKQPSTWRGLRLDLKSRGGGQMVLDDGEQCVPHDGNIRTPTLLLLGEFNRNVLF